MTEGTSMFKPKSKESLRGKEIKARSPIMTAALFPADQEVTGLFKRIAMLGEFKDKGSKEVRKSIGIEIVPEDGVGIGIVVPVVAGIRFGLEITGEGEQASSQYIGRIITIQKEAEKIPSSKGNAAWNFIIAIHPE